MSHFLLAVATLDVALVAFLATYGAAWLVETHTRRRHDQQTTPPA